jgi:hypothetical protein
VEGLGEGEVVRWWFGLEGAWMCVHMNLGLQNYVVLIVLQWIVSIFGTGDGKVWSSLGMFGLQFHCAANWAGNNMMQRTVARVLIGSRFTIFRAALDSIEYNV